MYTRNTRPLSHSRPTGFKTILYGADYYPEHWSAPVRNADPDLMAAAGMNVVRMAEFAWALLEPREGVFDFSLFDDMIARLGRKGIKTILCTPTAAPPRWLTKKYPDLPRVTDNGIAQQHGSRQHACYGNATFRQYSRKITQAMARHFARNAHVIGWQTDNEINCHLPQCHCASCQKNFRAFLQKRYKNNIAALNTAWGTAFWGQRYNTFADITTPKPLRPSIPNPAQVLDYHRFTSDKVTAFQHDQVVILRAANAAWFITHNGTFPHIDYQGQFGQDLDFMGQDLYPFSNPDPVTRPHSQAFRIDRTRSIAGNFVALEHQVAPTSNGQWLSADMVLGEIRRMVYTSLSRGIDGVLYFWWRSCRQGAEMYHGGVLDHDNRPRRRYHEVVRIGQELKKIAPHVTGTSVVVEAAFPAHDQMVNDAHASQSLGLPDPDMQMAQKMHRCLYEKNYAVGCVHPADTLDGLKLYIIPHWAWFNPAWVPDLEKFVARGGVLVIGAHTAVHDAHNNCIADTPPGCLTGLAGVTVEEFGRQNGGPVPFLNLQYGNKIVQTDLWYEMLQPRLGTTVVARWQSGHLQGTPAITVRKHGKGAVYYVGTFLTVPVFELLLPRLIKESGLKPLWPNLPAGVTVTQRISDTKTLWFFINTKSTPATLQSVPAGSNAVTGKAVRGRQRLDGYDALVVRS
jgi:beta-galactosidase